MPSQNSNFEKFENRNFENENFEDFGNDQNRGLPLAQLIDRMNIKSKLDVAHKDFKQILTDMFEDWIITSDEPYFDVHFDEVSDEIKDLIDYEDRAPYYDKNGFNFRIVCNGEVYERKWDEGLNRFYTVEDCLTDIYSELVKDARYDACTEAVWFPDSEDSYDESDGW